MRIKKDWRDMIAAELSEAGVQAHSIDSTRKHPRLTFRHNGTEYSIPIPGSPSKSSFFVVRAEIRRFIRTGVRHYRMPGAACGSLPGGA